MKTGILLLTCCTLAASPPDASGQTTTPAARPATPLVPPAMSAPAARRPMSVSELVRQVDLPYEQFTLANGLRVVVHTDRKAPVVAVSVWYGVGSKHEPAGRTGFAHLFEHLMFNGSENAPGDFFEPLKDVGATDYNGSTSLDRTNYFETVPTAALERALFLESDRMGHLLGAITQAKLDEQRGVVQNEKRQGDNQPYGLVQYTQLPGLFPASHPYGHTIIGSMADLDAASLQTVRDWFREHYGPNNAVLVLAGDVDAATARTLVERYFGGISRGPAITTPPAPIPSRPQAARDVITDRVATTLLTRNWVVPGLNDRDAPSLDVAAGVLGGMASSRLNTALVRDERLAVRVDATYESFSQLGLFTVEVNVRSGVDAATVERRLDQIVAGFLQAGPTADEVDRYATGQVTSQIQALESVGDQAATLAEGVLYSNDPGFFRRRMAAIAAQSPGSVRSAARRWLGRPVYALNVVPGPRPAYAEAAHAASAPGPTAPETPIRGTRGALPPVSEVATLAFPGVQRTRLTNGIELVYAQRTAIPITRMALSFDAGLAADVPDRLGTQALTLAMLQEGTTTRSAVEIARAKERLGATIAASASADRTTVSLAAPSGNLDPALDLLGDMVRNPAFGESDVARVRNQMLADIQQELTRPRPLANRVLPPLLYGPASPYANARGSDPGAVAGLGRTDLAAFHQAWLRPEKAKIFVVSDRPMSEVAAALNAHLGSWRGVGQAGAKSFGEGRPAEPRIVLVDRPDSPQSYILGALPTRLRGIDDLLAIRTANDALGGSFLGRINTDLRETRGWSYGVSGNFSQSEFAAPYVVSAPVQADKTGPSIAALRADIRDFVTKRPLTQPEFDRAVTGAIRALPGTFETGESVLMAMQANDLYRRPDDYQTTLVGRYRAMTRDQLDRTTRGVIDPDRFIWVVVGSAAQVRPQLADLGLPVETVAPGSFASAGPNRPASGHRSRPTAQAAGGS